jgi:hypothetical protein
MARYKPWPFVQYTSIHDLSKIAELSPSVMNARLLSDRSLYILQNLAAQDVILMDRYAVQFDNNGYYLVEDSDSEYPDYISASNLVALELSQEMTLSYPRNGTMWHDQAIVVWGNALAHVPSTTQRYNTYSAQGPAGNGDSFAQFTFLRKGKYNFYVLGLTYLDQAKIDWYIDGTLRISAQDWYSAGSVANVIKSATELELAEDGLHTITGKVNGKNPASNDYVIRLTKYWLEYYSEIGV